MVGCGSFHVITSSFYILKNEETQLVSYTNKKHTNSPNEFSFGLVCCVCLLADVTGVGEEVVEKLRGEQRKR